MVMTALKITSSNICLYVLTSTPRSRPSPFIILAWAYPPPSTPPQLVYVCFFPFNQMFTFCVLNSKKHSVIHSTSTASAEPSSFSYILPTHFCAVLRQFSYFYSGCYPWKFRSFKSQFWKSWNQSAGNLNNPSLYRPSRGLSASTNLFVLPLYSLFRLNSGDLSS